MLNKVTEYKMLHSPSPDEMTHMVNQCIRDGWVPSGPVVVAGTALYQAVVKFGG